MRTWTKLANENDDHSSRFDRMEKSFQVILEVQTVQGRNLEKIVSVQTAQADRVFQLDERVNQLAAKVDLVGAIRTLIDRIPPQSLR